MTIRLVSDTIKNYEYNLAKLKVVQEAFPNARHHQDNTFSDKAVNQLYTHFKFETIYRTLYVVPYCEIPFQMGDQEETIKVYSSPKKNKLAKASWRVDPISKKKTISFARLSVNMKNNKFKDDMLNACKTEIMAFIKSHPEYALDKKHLDSRLQKLLTFI